ncbi:MAG: TetR/AcrR family transcriptional regulator [Polaromonas sp.]|nr:TetR/AcrR family transcriptional regulator [Polaromonas sp.]
MTTTDAHGAAGPASTKDRLLEAATQVFLAHGFAAASMDMVRQQAGVSNGSLYHHYPTKSQLADALYAHTLRDFHSALLLPLTGRATAQSGVKGLIRAYITWVEKHPDRARLLHELKRSGGLAGGNEWNVANAEAFEVLNDWIASQVAAGTMRDLPFHLWMALVFAPAMSLTPRWVGPENAAVAPRVRTALEHAAWMAVAA